MSQHLQPQLLQLQQQQQQQQHQQQHQHQRQQHQQQRQQQECEDQQKEPQQQHHHQVTYKSCTFCALRKRRCDGLRPRCSFCIQRKQPDCCYRQKQPSETNLKRVAASRRKALSSARQSVGSGSSTPGRGMAVASRQRRGSGGSSVVPLKRCHLSVSRATGLVGMQENAFLNDYFECLGFLPLTSASMIRQAIVKIMLGSRPRKRQERAHAGSKNFAGRQTLERVQDMDGEGCGQALASRDKAGDPSTCILWCTIALGALVQGCPSDLVTGYLKLARDSLAECFDDTTVETARAYLVMAVLYGFLGEEEQKVKYSTFATSTARMLPEALPADIRYMLRTMGDNCKQFLFGSNPSCVPARTHRKTEEDVDRIPAVKEIVHETDICNLVLLTNLNLNMALHADMSSEDIEESNGQQQDNRHKGEMPGVPDELQVQSEHGGFEVGLEGNNGNVEVPWRPTCPCHLNVKGPQDTPRAGKETKTFIESVSRDLGRLSQAMERSDKCSGVGSLIYHGDMAFMHMMKGDMPGTIHAINICARVVIRFPGICRFRPHLVHCVLAGAASGMFQELYNPMRDAYNSTLPANATPAPPLDEWSGMSCVCNHVFCRSLQLELHHIGFQPSRLISVEEGEITVSASRQPSSGPALSLDYEETGRSTSFQQRRQENEAASAESSSTVTALRGISNEIALPPLIPAPTSPKQRDGVSDGGQARLDTAANATPPSRSEDERVRVRKRAHRDGGSTCAGDGVQPSAPGGRPDDVDFVLSGDSREGNEKLGQSQTTSPELVASHGDPRSPLVDGIGCHVSGTTVCGDPNGTHDMAVGDNTTEVDAGCWRGDWEGADVGLTDEDLMDAAEALMSSNLLDGESREGTSDSF